MTGISKRANNKWSDASVKTSTGGGGGGSGGGPVTTQFGVDVSLNTHEFGSLASAITAHRATYGGPLNGHTKYYDGGAGLAVTESSYNNATAALPSEQNVPVLCFKVWNLAAFNNSMDNATTPRVYVYYQEPEDDGKKGAAAAQPAFYCSVYAQMDAARNAHPNRTNVLLCKNLMGYQETDVPTVGFNIDAYHGGQTFVDYMAADCYSDSWRSNMRQASGMFAWLKTWADAHNMKWAIPEMGIAISKAGETQAARATRLQAYIDYLSANGCQWANYWCDGDTGNGDWRLETFPALTNWKTAMGR